MQKVAVGWEIYERTGSAMNLGYAGLASFLPALLLALVAGHVTDRYNRKFEELWSRIATGNVDSAGESEHRDRRFSAREWREQPFFALLKEAYLLHAGYVRELVDLAQADAGTKKRLAFLGRRLFNLR